MTGGDDSDSDPTAMAPTSAQWRLFEEEVERIQRDLDPGSDVQRDVRITGRLSGVPRQVDVLVKGRSMGQDFTVAVECKHYAKPIGIGTIDEFAGKLSDLDVDRGVLYALTGLTEPAKRRAAGSTAPKIVLGVLSQTEEPVRPDFRLLFTGFGDCPNENCMMGDISWQYWVAPSGATLRAGSCDSCGTFGIECPICEVVDLLDTGACYSCETTLTLGWDRKGGDVEDIGVTLPGGDEVLYTPTGSAPTPRSRGDDTA